MNQLPKGLLIILFVILFITTTDSYAIEFAETRRISDVVFPDKVLSECIETEAIEKGWEFIDEVKSLDCTRIGNAISIDGIDKFRQIQIINFSGGKIEDLSPLSNLDSIESAILSSNVISDLRPMSALRNLKILNLGNNEISDIRPLSGLAGIEVLELYSNNISDISALVNLKGLRRLSLYDNKIKDIGALYGLKNLVYLDLAGNPDLNASQISELKKHLPGIKLRCPFQVMEEGSAEGLDFDFKSKPVDARDFLELHIPDSGLRKLVQTYDRYNNLEDQEKAIFRNKDIKDFEGLEILSGLTELEISYSELENTFALRGLTKLRQVKLNDNHISNLEGLASLNHLTSIECSANAITDITPLKHMYHLEHLSLSNNQIADISALAELKNLKRLILSQNHITDISPLFKLSQIEFIELLENELIKCSDLERLNKHLPYARIICPKNCAHENMEAVRSKFVNDIASLKIYCKKNVSEQDCYSENDGQLYRTTFTSDVEDREPIDVLGALPGWQKKVFFFTEIIGAKGRTVTHRWYYNGRHKADVTFSVKGDRWRTWSSKNIGTHTSGVWQVKVVAENGCLIGHESIGISDDYKILKEDSGGWFNPGDAITLFIKKGDTSSVLEFCDRNLIERRNREGETPLMEAIKASGAGMVKGLLEKGANVFARDLSGKSTLEMARNTKNMELVDLILKALKKRPPWAVPRAAVTTQIENNEPQNIVLSGVGPSIKEVRLFTELMDMKGRTVVHRWMIDKNLIHSSAFSIRKDIEQCFSTFKIREAFSNKRVHVEVVDDEGRILFNAAFRIYDNDKKSHIAPIDHNDIDNGAIYGLFKAAGPIKKINYLVDKAKKSNSWAMLAKRKSMLKAIIHSRSITHLRYYLNQGADIDCHTALNMALNAGYDPMALYLKKRCTAMERLNPTKVRKTWTNPLLTAVIHNNGNMVRSLLRLGEDPDYTCRGDANVLTRAIITEHMKNSVIHDLLAYGADPNSVSTNTEKDTALMLAAKRCNLEIMKLLIAYGADPYVENKDGINTIDLLNKCPESQQKKVMLDFIKEQ